MNIADALRRSLRSHLSPILIESLIARHVARHDAPASRVNLSVREDIALRCDVSVRLFSGSNPELLRAAIRSALGLDWPGSTDPADSGPSSGEHPIAQPTWVNQVVPVNTELDVSVARHEARRVALEVGAKGSMPIRIATVVSELARNIFLYAAPGWIEIDATRDDDGPLVRLVARDDGPGIARTKLDSVFSGTYRSKSGLGKGLLAVKRVANEFELDTSLGGGTIIRVCFRGVQ